MKHVRNSIFVVLILITIPCFSQMNEIPVSQLTNRKPPGLFNPDAFLGKYAISTTEHKIGYHRTYPCGKNNLGSCGGYFSIDGLDFSNIQLEVSSKGINLVDENGNVYVIGSGFKSGKNTFPDSKSINLNENSTPQKPDLDEPFETIGQCDGVVYINNETMDARIGPIADQMDKGFVSAGYMSSLDPVLLKDETGYALLRNKEIVRLKSLRFVNPLTRKPEHIQENSLKLIGFFTFICNGKAYQAYNDKPLDADAATLRCLKLKDRTYLIDSKHIVGYDNIKGLDFEKLQHLTTPSGEPTNYLFDGKHLLFNDSVLEVSGKPIVVTSPLYGQSRYLYDGKSLIYNGTIMNMTIDIDSVKVLSPNFLEYRDYYIAGDKTIAKDDFFIKIKITN